VFAILFGQILKNILKRRIAYYAVGDNEEKIKQELIKGR
jgi:hypothetical protein